MHDADVATPAEVLRERLADARSTGLRFDDAWPAALEDACAASADPSWRVILVWAMDAFRRSYDGGPVAPVDHLCCPWDSEPATPSWGRLLVC